MARDVARDALYSGRINLWVEDDLTRVYLSALWNDPAVKFLVGGGHDGVSAILKDAEDVGYTNVFGVIDRDYRRSNFENWLVPGRKFRRFVIPRHEIENYLLETPALEGCRLNTHRKTPAEIDTILNNAASTWCWCVACRDVVSHFHARFFDHFMKHPTMPTVCDETDARAHIMQSDWFRALPRKSKGMSSEDRVHRLLKRAHTCALRMQDDGRWRREFPGKEFLRIVGNQIFNKNKAQPNYQPSRAEFDADLAKAVAAWQAANDAIPTDLSHLLKALKARIAPSLDRSDDVI